MKYSVSNWIYGSESIEKTVERLVKYGYDGIEIKGEPSDYDVKKLNDLFSSNNLEVSTVCGMWPWDDSDHMKTRDLANPDPKVRELGIKYGESALEFGNKLGAKTFICVVGGCGKVKQLHKKEWDYGIESVKKLAKTAIDNGITIAIEPINRYELFLLNNVHDGLKFVQEVNSEGVKLMLDTFHMNIEEADPPASIRIAGKQLIHLHVGDSNRQSVGRGHTDFKGIMRSLKEIEFKGYLAMEPLPPTGADVYDLSQLDPTVLDLYAQECIDQLRYFEKVV
ncbi:MAG: sugar phosphate isomerase/epimerase [Candidatus Helarchaeota archaeon]|nr:sugar phosphate isomerase/epimerase [Candidatus Helarchaeota archaeon]